MVESGVTAASICAMSMRSLPGEAADELLHLAPSRSRGGSGATSVAFMEALASMSTTTLRPSTSVRGARIAEGEEQQREERELEEQREEPLELREEARRLLVAEDPLQSFENGTATARRRSLRM
jgi:hypothetical protein